MSTTRACGRSASAVRTFATSTPSCGPCSVSNARHGLPSRAGSSRRVDGVRERRAVERGARDDGLRARGLHVVDEAAQPAGFQRTLRRRLRQALAQRGGVGQRVAARLLRAPGSATDAPASRSRAARLATPVDRAARLRLRRGRARSLRRSRTARRARRPRPRRCRRAARHRVSAHSGSTGLSECRSPRQGDGSSESAASAMNATA